MEREQTGRRLTTMSKFLAAAFVIAALGGLLASAASGQALGASLSCILLVDDDQDGPDVRIYYTSALDELGVAYDVWDMVAQGNPAAGDLIGYKMVIWFTGYPRSDTFTEANETAVAAYLDAEGLFFLSSEDYLYDKGLTTFGLIRLAIVAYTDDVNRTDPVGVLYSLGSGLGPYNLLPPSGWPGDLYTDNVVRRSS